MNALRLPKHEVDEFFKLKEKLFGEDTFVVPDDNDPDWKRYDILMAKIMSYLRRRKIWEQHMTNK